jgi:hypothetical protein
VRRQIRPAVVEQVKVERRFRRLGREQRIDLLGRQSPEIGIGQRPRRRPQPLLDEQEVRGMIASSTGYGGSVSWSVWFARSSAEGARSMTRWGMTRPSPLR